MASKRTPDRLWYPSELRRLESLRLEGQTAAQIALALGRTLHSVRQKLYSEGLRRPLRVLRWLELFRAGLSNAEAAERMGTRYPGAARTARWKLRQLGIAPEVR